MVYQPWRQRQQMTASAGDTSTGENSFVSFLKCFDIKEALMAKVVILGALETKRR